MKYRHIPFAFDIIHICVHCATDNNMHVPQKGHHIAGIAGGAHMSMAQRSMQVGVTPDTAINLLGHAVVSREHAPWYPADVPVVVIHTPARPDRRLLLRLAVADFADAVAVSSPGTNTSLSTGLRFSPAKTARLTLPSPRGVFTGPQVSTTALELDHSSLAVDRAAMAELGMTPGEAVVVTAAQRTYALPAWRHVCVLPVETDPRWDFAGA